MLLFKLYTCTHISDSTQTLSIVYSDSLDITIGSVKLWEYSVWKLCKLSEHSVTICKLGKDRLFISGVLQSVIKGTIACEHDPILENRSCQRAPLCNWSYIGCINQFWSVAQGLQSKPQSPIWREIAHSLKYSTDSIAVHICFCAHL